MMRDRLKAPLRIGLLCCLSFSFLAAVEPPPARRDDPPSAAGVRIVDTALCTLRLDKQTGDLVGLGWKSPRLEVVREARLGENFRILDRKSVV
jgi:hypothetical protein